MPRQPCPTSTHALPFGGQPGIPPIRPVNASAGSGLAACLASTSALLGSGAVFLASTLAEGDSRLSGGTFPAFGLKGGLRGLTGRPPDERHYPVLAALADVART